MLNITDDLSELVYVVDMDTYDLLYINRTGIEIFHLNDWLGQKCYRALQGKECPCEFCTNHLLTEDSLYIWNYYNPVVHRHYQLKDKIIEWNGRKAKVEIAIDTTELEEQKRELENALKTENIINNCAKKLLNPGDIRRSLEEVLGILGDFLKSDRAYIFGINGSTMSNICEWCAAGMHPQKGSRRDMLLPLIDGRQAKPGSNRYVVISSIDDIRETNRREYEELSRHGIHSLIAGPLIMGGKLTGYIGVDNYSVPMQQSNLSLFTSISYFIDAFLRCQQIMDNDLLTGLRNRNRYMRDIKRSFTFPIGVAYIDINGMKQINDKYGHFKGDEVLADIAAAISNIFENARCYRVGGDEFVVIAQEMPEDEFAAKVNRLKYKLRLHDDFNASVGSSWSGAVKEIEKLIFEADEKMYSNKKGFYRGRELTRRYRSRFDDVLGMSRPEVLEGKIAAGCFEVYYQPKIRVSTQKADGAEALARYCDEDGRRYSPAQFILYLEESRNISILDYYVFEQVCSALKKWQDDGITPVPVAVNFSRHTLQQECFIERIQEIREKYQIPTSLLEIEVTETIEASDREMFYQALGQLQKNDFRIALDDFGVSNANLSLLTDFDFDVLKIDKYVTGNILRSKKSQLIVEALIEICNKMGICIVAEGVETTEQLRLLEGMNCQAVQGYLFSRPIPEEMFRKQYLLSNKKADVKMGVNAGN